MKNHERLPTWTLTYRRRPWTLNEERTGGKRGVGGHYGRARLAKEWRQQFALLCRLRHVPALQWIDVTVLQSCRDRRLPDIGACLPAAKAAIDGIVDAGVIPDDRDPYVHGLRFIPPITVGHDSMSLRVTGPLCDDQQRLEYERQIERKLLMEAGLQ